MAIELKLIVFNVSLGLTMAQKTERNLPIETKTKKYTPLSLRLSHRHTMLLIYNIYFRKWIIMVG
jgi:hypothetical protein